MAHHTFNIEAAGIAEIAGPRGRSTRPPARKRMGGSAHWARGFTIVEAVAASTVLLICVLAVALTLGASSSEARDLRTTITASILGQELLEEISAKPFPISGVTTNPGWQQGQHNRSQYDDVADYNGYTDTSPLQMLDGTSVDPTPQISYTRTVSFSYMTSPTGPTNSTGSFGLITVTVTPSAGPAVSFVRVVSAASVTR
jgi:Tfp pilus assembly protein PilV